MRGFLSELLAPRPDRRASSADVRRMKDLAAFVRQTLSSADPTAYGAEVVDEAENRVVGRARNGVLSTGDPGAHAEVLAIQEACRALGSLDLSRMTLYTTCEPCVMCMGIVHWARVRRLVYGFTLRDSAGYFPEVRISARAIARRSPFSCDVVGPVERSACVAVLREQAALLTPP